MLIEAITQRSFLHAFAAKAAEAIVLQQIK
jgi:hypothetical protein